MGGIIMITIDVESKFLKRMPTDIDNMSDRYKTENNIFTFTSPALWTIEKNLFFLLRNSKKKSFDQKYKMRPDYLSFDEYGSISLTNLLMYVNSVFSIEDFDLEEVIIPSKKSIVEICSDNFPKRDIEDLNSVLW